MNIVGPLVSIGMPVLDCERTVSTAIRSIQAQTYPYWELVIIDDGSRDDTLGIVRSFNDARMRVVTDGRSRGVAARLNEAVALSRGTYFARMDGDDVCYPERLSLQVRYLQEHPDIDLLGGTIMVFRGDGDVVGVQSVRTMHEEIVGPPWRACILPHSTWVGKTEWFRQNPYDPHCTSVEDRELLLRTRSRSHFAGISSVVLGYRQNSVSLKKSWAARVQFSRALFRDGLINREYLSALCGVAGEYGKFVIDLFAVVTGLKYHILRNRAHPASPEDRKHWSVIWNMLRDNVHQAADLLFLPHAGAW